MRPNNERKRAKRAFTLPMVMIILFIAVGLISALMVIYENYHKRSDATLWRQDEYNVLQDAVEWGRALIRSDDYPEVAPSSKDITSASDLLIRNFDYEVTIANKTARVFVEVYDSKMEGNSVRLKNIKNNAAESVKMPMLSIPVMSDVENAEGVAPDLTNNATVNPVTQAAAVGVYTIRARITPSLGNRSLELLTTMNKTTP